MHVFIHSFTHDLFFIIKYHLLCARHYSRPQGDGKTVMGLGINNTPANSKKLGSCIKEINNAVLFSNGEQGVKSEEDRPPVPGMATGDLSEERGE